MEPYNYSLPQTAQQPSAFGQGFAQGIADRQAEQQREAQQKMQADLFQLSHSPTVANITSAMVQYPALADKFKPLLDNATAQQRQNRIGQASDVYAALQAGRTDIAQQLLKEHADAARNAGDEQSARSAEVMSQILDKGDLGKNTVLSSAGMFLSAAMGPDKFADVFGKLGSERRDDEMQPAKLSEAQASAAKAATAAKFAESDAALDLQKKGWDIAAIQNDIDVKKQNVKIAMMNASIARETNDLKRQELGLQVQKMQDERDEKVRTKAAEVASVRSDLDNMLSTVQQALDTAGGKLGPGALSTGPVAGHIPTMVMGPEVSDFREIIKTLQSQTRLQQLKNLKATGATMGQLSESEGEALEKSLVNLSLTQSPARLMANLNEAKRILGKFRAGLTTKYGVPETPVDLRPGTDPNQRVVDVGY